MNSREDIHAARLALNKIAEAALIGARQDERRDKSDWIRIWALARRALGQSWSSDVWREMFEP